MRTSLQLILWCALAASCLPTSGGTGIGPPNAPSRAPAKLYGIRIVQVYAGDPNLRTSPSDVSSASPKPFVQLANEGADAFSFSKTPLMLIGSGNRRVNLSTQADLPPQGRVSVDATALDLHWAAGELALTDTQFNAQAYLAWGNAPGQFNPGALSQAAADLGTAADAWVPVPFLNSTNLAIASDPNGQDPNSRAVGCIAPDPNRAAAAAAPATCPANDPNPLLQLTEVAPPTSVGAQDGWVEVLNLSPGPIDLYGTLLCYQSNCGMIDASVIVPAEDATHAARVALYLGANTGDHNSLTQVDMPSLPPPLASDEMALAPPGARGAATDLDTLNAAWSYVRYTNDPLVSPGTLFLDQLPAGLWSGDPAKGPRVAGESVALSPGASPAYTGWNPAAPTPAALNVAFNASDLNTWTSCSYAAPPEAAVSLAIQQVDLGAQLVTLRNLTGAAIDLTGKQLANPAASVPLPPRPLGAGQSLVVELHADATPCADSARVCWNGVSLASAELSILAADASLLQHLQWTGVPAAAPDPNSRGKAARDAHVWPGPSCQAQLGASGSRLTLSTQGGHSPADYVSAAAQ